MTEQGVAPIFEGDARFSVISPELIRMEHATGGEFVDDPSWFAIHRQAGRERAEIRRENGTLTIRTASISLVYQPDGKPFHSGNLTARIRRGEEIVAWHPGLKQKENLGATLPTLDHARGPVRLDDGLLAREGWFLLDDSRSVLFKDGWIAPRPANEAIDWYLFGYGYEFRKAIRDLALVGGRVPLPRKYVLGSWYSRFWPYTADEFKAIVREYEDHDFPLDVLVMDMDWHLTDTLLLNVRRRGSRQWVWGGYTWNRELISDPSGLIAWLHDRNIAVTLNDHPADGIQPHEEMYGDFMRAMGRDPEDGKAIPFDAGDRRFLESFAEHAYASREKEGVDFWWLDWQQEISPPNLPEITNLAILNRFHFQRSSSETRRGLSFGRWGGWGDHRCPIHFSGDADTGWNMLAFQVPFTAAGGNAGAFYWSHDIGGHVGERNEESYARWCQFGTLSAAMRSHSIFREELDRRPWTYPEWAENSMRLSFHLRSELMPYIYSTAWQAHRESLPLIRPMYLMHPKEEEAYHNGQQYYFGDHLLVAPITAPGVGEKRVAWQLVWFPDGPWFQFFTGEKFDKGHAVGVADIDSFPLYARGGIPLVMQPYTARPGTAPLTTLRIRCYPGRDGVLGESLLYEDDGISNRYLKNERAVTPLRYLRNGDKVTITIGRTEGTYAGQPQKRAYILEFPCTEAFPGVDHPGAKVSYDAASRTNRIELPAAPLDKPVVVSVEARETDPAVIRHAVSGKLSQSLLGSRNGMRNPGDEPLPDDLKEAFGAVHGVAFVARHTHPYFRDGKKEWIYCHNHHSDPSRAEIRIDRFQWQQALRSGSPLALDPQGENSPRHAAILEARIRYQNETLEITLPSFPGGSHTFRFGKDQISF